MKVAVTGAAGFVGKYLLPLLLQAGHEVVAISRKPAPGNAGDVKWVQANLLDHAGSVRIMQEIRAEVLIHLAWYTEHGRFWAAAENFAWSAATVSLVQEFHRAGGRRFVAGGTCAEYDWAYGYCVEGETPLKPSSVYGKSKDVTRQFLESHTRAHDLEFAWGRIFFPYGPGEPSTRLIPSTLRSLGSDVTVKCSHGRQFRDFIHVSDVASAFAHMALHDAISGCYNVGTGQPTRIAEVVRSCAAQFPQSSSEIQFGAIATQAGEPGMLVADVEKLCSTGWKPSVSLEAGLRDYARVLQDA